MLSEKITIDAHITQVIKHLDISAGDTVIFSHPGKMSLGVHERFVSQVKNMFPDVRVILLEEGMACEGVLRLGEANE